MSAEGMSGGSRGCRVRTLKQAHLHSEPCSWHKVAILFSGSRRPLNKLQAALDIPHPVWQPFQPPTCPAGW